MEKRRSPSDSASKTEEKAPSFISVKCHFGPENGKISFLKKGPLSDPFFGPKKNFLCIQLAVQSERSVQGQAITVDLTQIHPLQPECQPLKEGW